MLSLLILLAVATIYATLSVVTGLLIVTIWSYVLAVALGTTIALWLTERSTDG